MQPLKVVTMLNLFSRLMEKPCINSSCWQSYRLALLDIASRDLTVLTQNKSDESPYFSPNGGMIIYATNKDNKGILSIISLHNNQSVELMQTEGELREPSWSNYSN